MYNLKLIVVTDKNYQVEQLRIGTMPTLNGAVTKLLIIADVLKENRERIWDFTPEQIEQLNRDEPINKPIA
jgi:hypothetical protein